MKQVIFIVLASIIALAGCQPSTQIIAEDDDGSGYATSYGRKVKYEKVNGVTNYEHWEIPEYVNPSPNKQTLRHYLKKYLQASAQSEKYTVSGSSNPKKLSYDLRKSSFLEEQMNTTSLLSYIFYEDGKVLHSQHTPMERFGDIFTPKTVYHSNSMGKSMVSYVLGHAICEGYIDSIDSDISDWSLMKDTLYSEQKLIDLLNMSAQDRHVVSDITGVKPSGRWYNSHSLASFANNELKGTKPNRNKGYHYNGLVTNVLMNYTIYKSGSNYQRLLNKVFREKAGVSQAVYFRKNRTGKSYDGSAWYMFNATPTDYLRIGIAIMKDWQNDTCVGKYLKQVNDRRIRKNLSEYSPKLRFQASRSYGGQFHLNYRGMSNRDILGLEGYGGQALMIDASNSRIIVANTVHTDYDWDALVYYALRDGKLPD